MPWRNGSSYGLGELVGLCWEEGGGVGLAVKELGDPGPRGRGALVKWARLDNEICRTGNWRACQS